MSWKRTAEELIRAIVSLGHSTEFGEQIARNLGSERAMQRMIGYLHHARPRSAEEIADEMLSIMDDVNRWKQKKETEYYNERYNILLNEGLDRS